MLEEILLSPTDPDFAKRLAALRSELTLAGLLKTHPEMTAAVDDIVAQVAARGDAALAEFTDKFDKIRLSPSDFRVSQSEIKAAHAAIDHQLLAAISTAIANVTKYQSEIFVGSQNHPGIRYTPLERVGLCIPGASAPLPSTVIMTAVPAKVAGVRQIVVVSPPRFNGSIHPVILAACHELGITEVYRVGGAQAVAALAYGTDSVPRVDKIAGPGNWYVQLAKRSVYGLVDIDSIAGPSEVLIIATADANPAWLAADMLSQAEHNPGAAVLVTDSRTLAQAVRAELESQAHRLSRSQAALDCLAKYGAIIVYENIDAAVTFANDFAAEHLQVLCGAKTAAVAARIKNAGAIFLGDFSPVATGDYYAGPSHTLPSGQSARFFSALSSNDFIKATSIIEYTKDRLAADADNIIRLALTEGLDAHANSVRIRLK